MEKCPKCNQYSYYYDRIINACLCYKCKYRNPPAILYPLDELILKIKEEKEK